MSRIDTRVSLLRSNAPAQISHSQLSLDAGIQAFSREASNPLTLIPMATASLAYQAGRSAFMALGAGRFLSSALALSLEVSTLRASSLGLASMAGQPTESFLEGHGLLKTALDLSVFKIAGRLFHSSHFMSRHSVQAFAMMGAEDLASFAGLMQPSHDNNAHRFAQAFVASVQLEVGSFLCTGLTGQAFRRIERSLEASRHLRQSVQTPRFANAALQTVMGMQGSAGYRIQTDPRPIPDHIRGVFHSFERNTRRMRRALTQGDEIPPGEINRFGRNLQLIAKGRGSNFAIEQAKVAWSFANHLNPKIQRIGVEQMVAIAEDSIKDYHDSSIDLPYFEPAEPAKHIKSSEHVVDLAPNHPGFLDAEYRARRDTIAQIAKGYEPSTLRAGVDYGDIPLAPYISAEHAFWKYINELLEPLHRAHACREYLEARRQFVVKTDEIPQLRDLSRRLREMTGFQLVPVDGLVTTRAFLGTLALKIFLSTQYVRHHSRPGYTPEPDISHEITGHAAFLANPQMAELARLFGEAMERAGTDAEVDRLGNLYWHTIEYGILLEDGIPKAYGAGHLGSSGELPEVAVRPHLVFDAEALHLMELSPYDPTRMQPYYWAAPSFEALVELLGNHLRQWPRAPLVN